MAKRSRQPGEIKAPDARSRVSSGVGTGKREHPVTIEIWPEAGMPDAEKKGKKFKAKQKGVLKRGYHAVFHNGTHCTARIQISKLGVFMYADRGGSVDELTVPANLPSELLVVSANPTRRTEYPYAVFCLGDDEYAHENSMPIIIVDPDD